MRAGMIRNRALSSVKKKNSASSEREASSAVRARGPTGNLLPTLPTHRLIDRTLKSKFVNDQRRPSVQRGPAVGIPDSGSALGAI